MPGAPPGTLDVDPDAPRPRLRLIAYGPEDVVEEEIEDVGRVRELAGSRPVLWLNVDGLGSTDVIRRLGELFELHPLALEDVVNVRQRAKAEPYGDTLFFVCRMVRIHEELETEQLSMFLGRGFVLTFQERVGDCLDPVRERIRKGRGQIRTAGPDYLMYALLDAVVDNYFPVLEAYGDRLEELEQRASEDPEQDTMLRISHVKRGLQTLRHAVWPLRDAVGALLRERFPHVGESTAVYFRDCHDHTVRVLELMETYREQSSDLVNLHLSGVSNRMNEVMKVLTIIATLFIPLTIVAGLYGMNFDPETSPLNMPETRWYWGYPFALALMAASAVGLLLYFRRKRWL